MIFTTTTANCCAAAPSLPSPSGSSALCSRTLTLHPIPSNGKSLLLLEHKMSSYGVGPGISTTRGLNCAQRKTTGDLVTIKEEMDDTVAQLQWFVNLLGTTMDTSKLREQLQDRWVRAQQLARETSILLQESDQMDGHLKENIKGMNEAKLAQDLLAITGRFNEAQLLAAQKQPPFVPELDLVIPSSYRVLGSPKDSSVRSLLEESKRMLALLEDSEKTLQDAITEGNEEEVQQLQDQINEIRAIFKDLTFLISELGLDIDDVSLRIEESTAASAQARSRLLRDVKPRTPNCFLVCICRTLGMCFSPGS